jgi:hypothetical protein
VHVSSKGYQRNILGIDLRQHKRIGSRVTGARSVSSPQVNRSGVQTVRLR